MESGSFHHRSTTNFKQANKSHKSGRHETKSALKEKAKGRVESGETNVGVKQLTKLDTKQDRKAKGKQVLQKKKDELLSARRSASRLPRIIGIIGLSSKETLEIGWNKIVSYLGDKSNNFSPITTNMITWKQRVTLYPVERNLNAILDIAKVADLLIPIMSTDGVDDFGDLIVSSLKAQGVPTILGALVGLDAQNPKQQKDVKKHNIRLFETLFSDESKLMVINGAEDVSQLLRYACGSKVKSIKWRENRPCMLIDKLNYNSTTSSLQISGYLRGSSLNVNNLVHITDIGDFQLENVCQSADPYRNSKFNNTELTNEGGNDMNQDEHHIIAVPDPSLQESLDTENPFDPFASEQTWPTDQEIQDSKNISLETKHKKKLVPKGTSAYQASWFVEEDEDDEEDDYDDEEEEQDNIEEEKMEDKNVEINMPAEEEEEEEEMEEFVELDEEAEDQMNSKKDRKSEEEDLMYPDEVDTPVDAPARMRFQKYRGLKSFRSSPWDPKENLPSEYSRIFQFQNFMKSKKKVMQDSLANISPNDYITLTLKNFKEEDLAKMSLFNRGRPALVSGLLKYENKTSVIHFKVSKHHSYTEEVRSKDLVTFHYGFRRFNANPIYSESNVACDKHKYENFLHAGSTQVATIYGPISFPPMPILLYKNNSLVATGSLHSVNPDRIILKKIVLTGSPYKIHKRYAVVRHMFFNRDDINYFMPVEIYTKHGRAGRILEPLGTHGYMKVQFDTPILQHDTICMNLYKRVYPKWNKPSLSETAAAMEQ